MSCWDANSNGADSDFQVLYISQCFSAFSLPDRERLAASVVCFLDVWSSKSSGWHRPESGMRLRHCALWQSLCCKLLSEHQRSGVMISVNTHGEEE